MNLTIKILITLIISMPVVAVFSSCCEENKSDFSELKVVADQKKGTPDEGHNQRELIRTDLRQLMSGVHTFKAIDHAKKLEEFTDQWFQTSEGRGYSIANYGLHFKFSKLEHLINQLLRAQAFLRGSLGQDDDEAVESSYFKIVNNQLENILEFYTSEP